MFEIVAYECHMVFEENTFCISQDTFCITTNIAHHRSILQKMKTMMKKLIYSLLLLMAASCSESDALNQDGDGPRKKIPFSNYSNEVIIQWNTTAHETM